MALVGGFAMLSIIQASRSAVDVILTPSGLQPTGN
jgi:hypothetical protein